MVNETIRLQTCVYSRGNLHNFMLFKLKIAKYRKEEKKDSFASGGENQRTGRNRLGNIILSLRSECVHRFPILCPDAFPYKYEILQ